MVGQLVNYILQQLSQGYTLDQLRGYLLSQNYTKKDVDADINSVINMQSESLKPYIQQQLNSGQELHVIRKALVDNHYDVRIVDNAMKSFKTNFFTKLKSSKSIQRSQQQTPEQFSQSNLQQTESQNTSQLQNTNQQTELKNYVRQQLSQGYTLENIQSYLLQQGYDSDKVNLVINSFRQSHFHIPKTTAFLSLIVILIVIFSFMFISGNLSLPFSSQNSNRASYRAMDLEIEDLKLKSEYFPGDEYNFKVSGINTGSEKGYDISLKYYLESSSGRQYGSKSKAIILDYTISEIIEFEIPSNIPEGKYTLWLIADYGSDIARTSMELYVGSKTKEIITKQDDFQKEDVEKETVETSEKITNVEEKPTEKQNYSANIDNKEIKSDVKNELTFVSWKQELTVDTISQIQSQSLKDPDYALYLCHEIESVSGSDACIRLIAETTNDRSYCNEVSDATKIDLCYMSFARTSSDDSICDDIKTSTIQKTCEMLVRSNQYKEMYGLKTTSDIINYLGETQQTDSETNSELLNTSLSNS